VRGLLLLLLPHRRVDVDLRGSVAASVRSVQMLPPILPLLLLLLPPTGIVVILLLFRPVPLLVLVRRLMLVMRGSLARV
jgi:hypothetical protein